MPESTAPEATMSETKMISARPVSSDALDSRPTRDLDHLPGPPGHWLFGNVRDLTPDPRPFLQDMRTCYGDCFTVGFLRNQRALMMMGPAANELLLLDRNDQFSSRLGWQVVEPFFGRNILVRDFADHQQHRKMMTCVFKPDALAQYLGQMQPIVNAACARYLGPTDIYRGTKQMALDIAIQVFAGVTTNTADWYRDLDTVLSHVMAVRNPLPGSRYRRALRARDRLRDRLHLELQRKRTGSGQDLFSHLVNQRDDLGRGLADQDVVDHMFGILFAAHDTTASTLAMMFWLLATHTDWQERARAECETLYRATVSGTLDYASLARLPTIEAICKETLRLYAPIQFIPRRSVSAFTFAGHHVPANTWILLAPQLTHFDPAIYPQPDQFDPQRFLDNPTPPPFSFLPFGRGSHMCLGMHFAYMEIKAVLYRLLLTRKLASVTTPPMLEYLPVVRPSTAMPVNFIPL
ncbi:MAG: cytochrome P450 [Pseudomonadota bacterium]